MSAKEIVEQIKMKGLGHLLDWRGVRDQIHLEYSQADSNERASLLYLNNVLMDEVEKRIPNDKIEEFREIRKQDYNLLVVTECLVDGKVSPIALAAVTHREILKGRMSAGDELRQLASNGSVNRPVAIKSITSGWRRIFRFGQK